jgi:F0F1-type ATP synthase gamma subunit
MSKDYDHAKHDIIVIGHHGAILLTQAKIPFIKYFKLPEHDQNINVEPLVREIRHYSNTTVYYQSYISLMVQEVKHIGLKGAVNQLSASALATDDVISEETYIFEPSIYDLVAHLERSMLQIALSQLIYESKLAQYASRFKAMGAAHERAEDMRSDLHFIYSRTKRNVRDEQLKQIISGLKKVRTA